MITRRHYAILITVVSILVIGAGAWAFATSTLRPGSMGRLATTSASVPTVSRTTIVECVPGNAVRQPRALTLACADANEYLMNLTWRDWGQPHATAEGVLVTNDCKPTCVSGRDERSRVLVEASGLVQQDGAGRYTTLAVRATGASESHVYRLPGFEVDFPELG